MNGLPWVIDLDGVVWRGHDVITGSVVALRRLHGSGVHLVFVTNNSSRSAWATRQKLESVGVPAGFDVVTSSLATASILDHDESVLVVGEDGLTETLRSAGIRVVERPPADVVVVGICRAFDYAMLTDALRAVEAGARLVATNTDATFPTAAGMLAPGAGSIVAAIETASGVSAEVAGKPSAAVADLIRDMAGDPGMCVGDRFETDGLLATELECDFALVLSGVTSSEQASALPPGVVVADDLGAVVAEHCGDALSRVGR